ncbi:hypothetical protein [Streptomyces sp. XY431]|uniref:hypothetical protein n=1 Tax=Streptomyces sp. XY431 TaxID=1415562 RepID=UPI0013317BE8|nr:hypothetical protein [Streptomyces sp. XY431]
MLIPALIYAVVFSGAIVEMSLLIRAEGTFLLLVRRGWVVSRVVGEVSMSLRRTDGKIDEDRPWPCCRPVETMNSSPGRCRCLARRVNFRTGCESSTGTDPRSRTGQTTWLPSNSQVVGHRRVQPSPNTSRRR